MSNSAAQEGFLNLQHSIERLASVQENSEKRLDRVEQVLERLAEAQTRTEQKVKQLAEAQARTEHRVDKVEIALQKLAEAQTRTEEVVSKLVVGQAELQKGQAKLEKLITHLGSRWGIYTEGAFRSTIQGIFRKMEGITVKEGFYGGRQVDVVIHNGEHILLEITSRMHAKDIDKLYTSADDYFDKEGIDPKLMVATSYISPKLMDKIKSLDRPIEIFSYEGEE